MSKHILVVDDSVSIRQMVEMTLKGAGYTVTTAQDGQEAFDKCKSQQFNFVLGRPYGACFDRLTQN